HCALVPLCLRGYSVRLLAPNARLLPVLARADAKRLVEAAAEVEGAVEADFGGDLLDRAPGGAQEAGGLAQTELAQRLGDGLAGAGRGPPAEAARERSMTDGVRSGPTRTPTPRQGGTE